MSLNLPTLADVQASRTGPLLKGKSRLELKAETKSLATNRERHPERERSTSNLREVSGRRGRSRR